MGDDLKDKQIALLTQIVQGIGLGDRLAAIQDRHKRAAEEGAEQARLYAGLKDTRAAPWDEDKTPFQSVMWLQAATWKPPVLFDVPPLEGLPGERGLSWKTHAVKCPGTDRHFLYVNHVLPPGHALSVRETARGPSGRAFFDGPVLCPTLFEILPHMGYEQEIWMSITPMEVLSQRPMLREAFGRVVVGGLGLGWFLNKVCADEAVTEVVVVEKDRALLNWLMPAVAARHPAVAGRPITWVADDVYAYMAGDTKNWGRTQYLLDIWAGFGEADLDPAYGYFETMMPKGCLHGWGRTPAKR